MRVALLPAGGDPFLIAYWLRHYAAIWADEVDELRIAVCGQNDPEAQAYIAERVAAAPHAFVEFLPMRSDHGSVLHRIFEASPADLVMFCEDDAFVRRPGVVDERFRKIETGEVDVIGTARGNASPKMIEAAERRFGELPQTASGETGHSLYPCFLFAKRADLERVTNFSVNGWPPNTYVPSLDYTTDEVEACDTFVLASWELRAMGLKVEAEAAYRSGVQNTSAPWFHVGSLSSGYGGSFMSDMDAASYAGHVASVSNPGELIDWHKRMAWWTRVVDKWDGGIPTHRDAYIASLEKYIDDVRADRAEIARWRATYDPLITWPEV